MVVINHVRHMILVDYNNAEQKTLLYKAAED